MLPGLILVGLYIFYMIGSAIFNPESAPPAKIEDLKNIAGEDGLPVMLSKSLLPPLLLIIAVLGSILLGAATPTESCRRWRIRRHITGADKAAN